MIVLEIVLSLERSPPAPSQSAAAARICKDKLAIGGGQLDDRQSLCQAFSLALPLSLSFYAWLLIVLFHLFF